MKKGILGVSLGLGVIFAGAESESLTLQMFISFGSIGLAALAAWRLGFFDQRG